MNAADTVISTVPSNGSEVFPVFTIPTKGPSEPKKVILNTSSLNEENLKSLKQEDPFLYYSIPSVRRAAVFGNKCTTDVSSLQQSTNSSWVEVQRRSCISFECHTDLILENCTNPSPSASGRTRARVNDDEDDDAPFANATHDPMDVDFDSLIDQLLLRHKQ